MKILNLQLTCQVEEAIAGADVRQEGVPQALARVGAFHQAGDVHHIEESWDFAANRFRHSDPFRKKNWKQSTQKLRFKTVYPLVEMH